MNRKEYNKEYKEKNRKRLTEYQHSWYLKNKERLLGKNKEYLKDYQIKNRAKLLITTKLYKKKLRDATIAGLGGQCIECGFNDIRALQIDHINGGGVKEFKERKYKGDYNKQVLQSFLNKENKYQLLCANCNWIKRSINNEVRK